MDSIIIMRMRMRMRMVMRNKEDATVILIPILV